MPASKLAATRAQAHGNQSHFPDYVRESRQGLRGLCPQSESWRAVRFHRVEELLFGERSSVVLDPAEERIKAEFSGVKRTFLPLHSILRIDEVKKHGAAKITVLEAGANVAQFPLPIYSTPPGEKK